MLGGLLQWLKETFGGAADERPAAPKINERMNRITAGEPFSGPRKKLTNLSGGSKTLTPDQIRAIRHEALRQKQEQQAEVVLEKVRAKLGRLKLEQLAALPKAFAPGAVEALRKQFPELGEADFAVLADAVPRIDRDVCDDLARVTTFGAAERTKLVASLPEPDRERLGAPAAAILEKLPELAREGVLRLPRIPVAAKVDGIVTQWKSIPAEEVRGAAQALAQFGEADLAKAIKPPPSKPPPPAKSVKASRADKKPPPRSV